MTLPASIYGLQFFEPLVKDIKKDPKLEVTVNLTAGKIFFSHAGYHAHGASSVALEKNEWSVQIHILSGVKNIECFFVENYIEPALRELGLCCRTIKWKKKTASFFEQSKTEARLVIEAQSLTMRAMHRPAQTIKAEDLKPGIFLITPNSQVVIENLYFSSLGRFNLETRTEQLRLYLEHVLKREVTLRGGEDLAIERAPFNPHSIALYSPSGCQIVVGDVIPKSNPAMDRPSETIKVQDLQPGLLLIIPNSQVIIENLYFSSLGRFQAETPTEQLRLYLEHVLKREVILRESEDLAIERAPFNPHSIALYSPSGCQIVVGDVIPESDPIPLNGAEDSAIEGASIKPDNIAVNSQSESPIVVGDLLDEFKPAEESPSFITSLLSKIASLIQSIFDAIKGLFVRRDI